VLDGDQPRDVLEYAIAGSSDGTVHVLYAVQGRSRMLGQGKDSEQLYARVMAGDSTEKESSAALSGQSLGNSLPEDATQWLGYRKLCLVVEPGSGDATLVVNNNVYFATYQKEPIRGTTSWLNCGGPYGYVDTAGAGRLHSIAGQARNASVWKSSPYDLNYRLQEGTTWTELKLGPVREFKWGEVLGHAIRSGWNTRLAAHGKVALAVWERPDRHVVARFIRLSTDSRPGSVLPARTPTTEAAAPSLK
jgi:hypothetical protein